MQSTGSLIINFEHEGLEQSITVTQFDTGKKVMCHIAGISGNIGTAMVYCKKPSGLETYTDADIIDDHTVGFSITEQMNAEIGDAKSQLQLFGEDKSLTSYKFKIQVQENLIADSRVTSADDYPAFRDAIEKFTGMTADFSNELKKEKELRKAEHSDMKGQWEEAVSTEKSERMQEISIERARINNLIANNNPTEGNSELIDIRVGEDGNVYNSAGDAVRYQLSDIKNMHDIVMETYSDGSASYSSYLTHARYMLFEHPITKTGHINRFSIGCGVGGTIDIGIFKVNGTLFQYRSVYLQYELNDIPVSVGENIIECDIPVEEGQYIAIKTKGSAALYYKNDNNGYTPTWSIFEETDNKYLVAGATANRFYDISWYIANDSYIKKYIDQTNAEQSEKIETIREQLNIEKDNPWKDKTCVTFGDSITYGNTWQPALKELMGFSEMWNRGASNSTMSDVGKQKMVVYTDTSGYTEDASSWLYQSPYTGDGSDIPEGTEVEEYFMYSDDRISKIPEGKDLCLIMCGTNDFYNSINESNEVTDIIGDTSFTAYWSSQDIYDNSTLIGALCTCIKKIMGLHPAMKIVIIGMPYNNGLRNNETGKYFYKVLDGIRDAARSMGVPYIDIVSKLQWNNNNLLQKCSDGVHPTNSEIGKEIAYAIASDLKNIYPL